MTRLQWLGLAVAASFFAVSGVHAEGDKAAGRKLIYTCNGCHGVPGYTNAYPQYPVPRIAGQNAQYIVNALHGYQSGDRTHPTMTAQAQSLSEKDIQDIAAYLSSLAPAMPANTPEQSKELETLGATEAGTKAKDCISCHGADGNSVDPQYPRLAGQYSEYLQQILHEYKDGRRKDFTMKGKVASLSDQDIEQISNYFSSMPQALGKPNELSTLQGHIQGDKD